MKKYLVIAGRVRSRMDGDVHWITGAQLAHLYGVDPRECIFADERRLDPRTQHWIDRGLVILRPRYGGDYRLPGKVG